MNSRFLFLLFLIVGVVLTFILDGCAEAITRPASIDGIAYIEHIDTNDAPCRPLREGCYMVLYGVPNVWYSSFNPKYVREHELAHVQGMWHTPWSNNCAVVLIAGGKYRIGQTICDTEFGERII